MLESAALPCVLPARQSSVSSRDKPEICWEGPRPEEVCREQPPSKGWQDSPWKWFCCSQVDLPFPKKNKRLWGHEIRCRVKCGNMKISAGDLTGHVSCVGVPSTLRTQHSCSMSFSPGNKGDEFRSSAKMHPTALRCTKHRHTNTQTHVNQDVYHCLALAIVSFRCHLFSAVTSY